ncbi:MAG: Protease HtpX [Candidatus Heimdallarchaeota archaeon LC_3]|nr:MAG: Protease HtpX [Candidatus Heimdallarchaeota archaeon LC_3]
MSELESWKILSGMVFFLLIIGFFSIYKSKNHSNLRLSKTITGISIVYSIFAFGVILFIVSMIILGALTNFRHISFENFPLINFMIFDIGTVCVDLFSILIIFMTSSILLVSFLLSQVGLHALSQKFEKNSNLEMTSKIKSSYPWLDKCQLVVFNQDQPDAFSFTLLHVKMFKVIVKDWIVLSSGLLKLLNEDELESVLAHEHSHIIFHDTRYSHVIFTFTKLVFFDPFLKILKKFINNNHEFKADMYAAQMIKKPRSLAQALAKLLYFNHEKALKVSLGPTAFFDSEKSVIIERINALLNYADQNNLDL